VSPTVRFRCLSIPSTGSAVYLRARSPRCVAPRLPLVTRIFAVSRSCFARTIVDAGMRVAA
jgi:hypothetical protein